MNQKIKQTKKALEYLSGKKLEGDFDTVGQVYDAFNEDCECNGVKIPVDQLPEGYPYEETVKNVFIEEAETTAESRWVDLELSEYIGESVVVIIDGEEYEREVKLQEDNYLAYIGNLSLLDDVVLNGEDTGEPFVISCNTVGDYASRTRVKFAEEGTHTSEVYDVETTIVPMAEKFLPPGIGGDESYYHTFDVTTTVDGATEETIYTVDNVENYDKSFLESLNAYIQSCFDKGTMPKFIMNVDGRTRYLCVGAYTSASEYGIYNNIFFGQNLKLFLIWSHDEENGEDLGVYIMQV